MTIRATNAQPDGSVIGYMCATDWEWELGAASDGNRVFPSLKAAKEHLKCAESCGVVQVEVRYKALVLQGNGEFATIDDGS